MIPRRAVPLVAGIVLASLAVFAFRGNLPDTRRLVLALAAIGFFVAPRSDRRLSLAFWLPAVAAVSWAGQWVGASGAGLGPWLAVSIAGALLAVRGGSRAVHYYLPGASGEEGEREQRLLRRQLWLAVGLYLAAYVSGGSRAPDAHYRAAALLLAAVFFVRYLLLQSKFLGIPAVPLRAGGLVAAQRWPFLFFVAVVCGSRLPERWLPSAAGGPLLLTSALLFLLAGLLFVVGLSRGALSRHLVRRASFGAGLALAVAFAAVFVELEGLAPRRFAAFGALASFFLVVLPFVTATTRLLDPLPHASELIPRPVVGVMLAPITAVNGLRWSLSSSGFLYAASLLVLLYWLLVAIRSGGPLRTYLAASLGVTLALPVASGIATASSGSSWQLFLLSLGFVLHAVDGLGRARVAKPAPA